MAFYSQGKEFLNLPEQVQKNATDIADLKTKEATNATDIASNTADLADLKSRTQALETNTTTPEGTIATGTLDVEKDANFGSNIEVDGGLTLNSPSDLHFKTGDTDYTDFNEFKKTYYAEAGIAKYAGAFIPQFEDAYAFEDLVNYTDCDFMFSNAIAGGGGAFLVPDFGKTTARFMFASMKGRNFVDESDYPFTISLGNIDCINGYSMFFALKNCTQINVQTGKTAKINNSLSHGFESCHKLVSIGEIDVSGVTYFTRVFTECESLKSIHMKHFKFSFSIDASTAFETADLVEIISNLDAVTTPQTLTMGATNLAKLTQDQILVATGKGWTLA